MLYFNYSSLPLCCVSLPLLIWHCLSTVFMGTYILPSNVDYSLDENGVTNFFYSHSSTKLPLHLSTLIYTSQSISIYTCKGYIRARPLNCPSGYVLNPVASSCIRLETSKYYWEDAKARCEAQGENLAVFTTKESLAWIRNKAPAGIHHETTYPLHHLS